MSVSRNPDAVIHQDTPFRSRVPPSKPLVKSGHKPGVLASPKDRVPEFHAKPLPPGSAPPSQTFKPTIIPSEIDKSPDLGPVYVDDDVSAEPVSAIDTLVDLPTADKFRGLGHPVQAIPIPGQTSRELRHDGSHGRKRQRHGLVGVGASGVSSTLNMVNERDPEFAHQRALERDEAPMGGRRVFGGPPAEEKEPERAETVASEAPRRP